MTDNIQKLYEIAGVDYEERYNNCTLNKEGECRFKGSCDICKYVEERYIYPTFTAEKQLELENYLLLLNMEEPLNINFSCDGDYIYLYYMDVPEIDLSKFKEDDITVNPYTEQLWIKSLSKSVDFCNETFKGSGKTRGEALSGLVIELWNDLTDEQKQEIKRILE